MDYETTWPQRAKHIAANRRNFLPTASDGSTVNVLTIGLILAGNNGSKTMNNVALASAARGEDSAFEPGFRGIGEAISGEGLDSPSTVIRLGHEMNTDYYPWSTNNVASVASSYIEAWRRAQRVLKQTCPRVRFSECWNSGGTPDTLEMHYVGDDYVDVLGIDFYDFHEANKPRTGIDVESGLNIGDVGEYAHLHGKKVSLDEWGLDGRDPRTSSRDNPTYVRYVFEQLLSLQNDHVGIVSHDAYFDKRPFYTLTDNPASAACYRALWTVYHHPRLSAGDDPSEA